MPNIINGLGQIKVGVKPTPAPVPLLLNTYSGAIAAYSLRKLNMNYSGAAIRVRRSSDNTTLDVGFKSDGTLDTTALLTFVGANNGFVSIWYDQSGNGSNLVQNTAANQARIVQGGGLDTLNGKPALVSNTDYTGPAYYQALYTSTISNPATMFHIGSNFQSAHGGYLWDGYNTQFYCYSYWTNWYRIGGNGEFAITGINQNINTQRIINAIYNGSTSKLSINNGLYVIGNTGNVSSSGLTLGGAYGGGYVVPAKYQEHIVYTSNRESDVTGINTNMNTYYSTYTYDADAQAFINAAGISDSTQANAITTLVIDLKTANIWAKMKAIYPFVGGTATTHKFNLKDPRDLNAAFRLTFAGGGTHSSNGYQLNGLNSWGDANLVPSSVLTNNNISLGFYSRTNRAGANRIALGAYNQAQNSNFLIYPRQTNNTAIFNISDNTNGNTVAVTSTLGFFQGARNNSSTQSLSNINGTNYSFNYNSVNLPNAAFFVGSIGSFSSTYVDTIQLAFAYVGDNLSSTDLSNYYTAVQKYQTTLGRQV